MVARFVFLFKQRYRLLLLQYENTPWIACQLQRQAELLYVESPIRSKFNLAAQLCKPRKSSTPVNTAL
jgi:hypothetical protein